MKLHLPLSLRSALVAAFVSLTLSSQSVLSSAYAEDGLSSLSASYDKSPVTYTESQRGPLELAGYEGVSFSACGGTAMFGGAVYNTASYSSPSAVVLSGNGTVSFNGNIASAWGGAICNDHENASVSLNNNGNVLFNENSAAGYYGGAICNQAGTFEIDHNGRVVFSGNSINADFENYGGAIYNAGSLVLSNNEEVTFSGNTSSGRGGALYASGSSAATSLQNNGDVSFVNNTAATQGGAIYVNSGSLSLTGNGDMTFSGNTAHGEGGAIYSNNGTVSLEGNGNVLFEKNVEINGGTYRLRSIYSKGGVSLSAAEGKTITIRDSVYSNGATFNLRGSGDVIFSGATTESDLLAAKGGIRGTADEIRNSRTSVIADDINLRGGRLIVESGATLKNTRGSLTVARDANATLRLNNGTLEQSGNGIYVYGGSGLEVEGANTITTTKLTLQDNTFLSFVLGEQNLTTAALSLTGTLNTGTLDLSFSGSLTPGGRYALMTATGYDTSAWTADKISVSTEGVSFNDLVWENNTLYLNRSLYPNGSITYTTRQSGPQTLKGYEAVSFNDISSSSSGGAIYNRGVSSLSNNGYVTFSENRAYSGGAICNDNYATFSLNENGDVNFSGNSASSYLGGAIYNGRYATFTLNENGDVTFSGNGSSYGGSAIYNGRYATFTLNESGDVSFSRNTVSSSSNSYGGAICNEEYATFTLSGNGNVLFEKNAEIKYDTYRLRSIYSTGTLNLSAAAGKSILFKDSVYAAGTVNLNQDGTGDIIFTGISSEADLREVKGGIAGTAQEIADSRSSVLNATVTLGGGTLQVLDGVSLTVKDLTAAAGSELVLHDGAFATTGNTSLAAVTTSGNSTLAAAEGGTLTLTQAITNNGELTLSGTINADALSAVQTGPARSGFINTAGEAGASGFYAKSYWKTELSLTSGEGTVSSDAAVVIYQGNRLTNIDNNGIAKGAAGSINYSTYYINGDTASLSAILAMSPSAKVQMAGGTLTVDTDFNSEVTNDSSSSLVVTAHLTGNKEFLGYKSVSFKETSCPSNGGAIYNNRGTFTLSRNESVTFSGNTASCGGAIYNNQGTFSLSGNGDVLFEKNAEITGNIYRLRSIYSTGTLNLSASEGKSILFKDSVYASGTVNLNQNGMGDIIFTGASTEVDLRELKGGIAGTAEEIANSRSSVLDASVKLGGGTLQVRDAANLTVRDLTAAAGSGLVLHDGAFTTTGNTTLSAVSTSGNSSLAAAEGGTLTLTQAITNNGELTLSGIINADALTSTQAGSAVLGYINTADEVGASGFASFSQWELALTSGTGTVSAGDAVVLYHGNRLTSIDNNGIAKSEPGSIDYSTYYINGDTASLSAILAKSPSAKVQLAGGTLTVDTNFNSKVTNYSSSSSLVVTAHLTGNKEFLGYESVLFDSAFDRYDGGAILNSGKAISTLSGNESVTFSGNSATWGGAICNAYDSTFVLSNNGNVTFIENTAGAHGGAIQNQLTFTLSDNGNVAFIDNKTSYSGGAIYNQNNGRMTLSGNGNVSFSGNSASEGGAVANHQFGGFLLVGNGVVTFSGNKASADSSYWVSRGGAICSVDYGVSATLNDNEEVKFCKNSVIDTFGNSAYGGAICNANYFTMRGNGDVMFCGNTVSSSAYAYGGAIYNNYGSFTLSGNGNVLFEKNAEIENDSYRLRSIYSAGGSLNLSSSEGKSILFKDSVYASGTVKLNQDGTGDIIFTGASTEADLREVKGGIAGTAQEILNSRTSEIATNAKLYGGRLVVEEGAILKGQGITFTEGGDATIRLNGGTLDETGYAIAVSSGSGLEFEGENTLAAARVSLADNSFLSFILDEAQTAVNWNANLDIQGGLSLHLTHEDKPVHDSYALLAMQSGNSVTGWDAAALTISGTTAEHLVWEGNTLYYRPMLVQENGDTTLDKDVDTEAAGGTIGGKDDVSIDGNGHTLNVKNEVQLVQMALKNGTVKLEGENNGIVSVTLTEGGELVLTAGAGLKTGDIISMVASGKGELVISGNITLDDKGMKGKAGAQATVSHANAQVLGDATISNVRVEDSVIDLAEGSTVGFEHVVLAATTRITDDPATANLDDVTAELVMGVNASLTGSDLLMAGTTLTESGSTGAALTLAEASSVVMLEATTFDSVTLTGTSLVLELAGMDVEIYNGTEWIGISFTSGTDYATFDPSLAVTLSIAGVCYESGYTIAGDDGPTTMYFRGGKEICTTPEPATATLSLLALAALAARRRRR